MWDDAYGGGTLTISEMLQALSGTFCHECFLGTVSAGSAAGANSPERKRLHEKLSAGGHLPTDTWNPAGCTVQGSPLVTGCRDGTKQGAIPGILQWYKAKEGVLVKDSEVYFFDDRSININPFKGLPYNAQQISCRTRDSGMGNAVGLCGAEKAEFTKSKGVHVCAGTAGDEGEVEEVEEGRYARPKVVNV